MLSHWRRLVGMLFEPRRVMEDLARQPRWILPVLLSQVPPAIFFISYRFRPSMLLRDVDSFGSLAREIGAIFLRVFGFSVAGFVTETAVLLLVALALVGLMRALSRILSIRHALALVSYSLLPMILVSIANRVFQTGVALLQLESPLPHWLWLNAATLLDRSASHLLVYSFVSQIGVFPLWRWLLVALGLTIVVRSVSFRVALGAAVIALTLVGSVQTLVATYVARLAESNLL